MVYSPHQATAVLISPAAIDVCDNSPTLLMKPYQVQRGRLFEPTNDQNSSISKSLILGDTDSSGIVAAEVRNALSTVFELTNSTREMSRKPRPF